MSDYVYSIIKVNIQELPSGILTHVPANRKAITAALAPYLEPISASVDEQADLSRIIQATAKADIELIENLAKLQDLQNDSTLEGDARVKALDEIASQLLEKMVMIQTLVIAAGKSEESSADEQDIDIDAKNQAEEIMSRLGISPNIVINALYKQIILTKSIPFLAELSTENNASLDERI
ncbi:MAG: type II toxin-antitoxin system RelB/DinJ family antitoxin [Peptostreptococcaceae bacterium]|nr:type II toxin-antitoxin system RelB/DinJ family antitoxin [Peptostreptococcaceae bacterium]